MIPEYRSRLTIKLDRLIVISKSSVLGWFFNVSLIVIIKGRSSLEVSLIVIIKPFLPLLSQPFKSDHDSPDQTDDRIKL